MAGVRRKRNRACASERVKNLVAGCDGALEKVLENSNGLLGSVRFVAVCGSLDNIRVDVSDRFFSLDGIKQ